MCYSHFTDKSKLERLQNTLGSEHAGSSSQTAKAHDFEHAGSIRQTAQAYDSEYAGSSRQTAQAHDSEHAGSSRQTAQAQPCRSRCSLRMQMDPVDWSLCLFCQTDVLNKPWRSVMTTKLSDQIIQASSLEHNIYVRLAGVIDLIAAAAKYHLTCLRAFIRSTDKTKKAIEHSENSDYPDLAMTWLCKELQVAADKEHLLLLDDVWEQYKVLSEKSSTTIPLSYCSRRATFREKLHSQFGRLFSTS